MEPYRFSVVSALTATRTVLQRPEGPFKGGGAFSPSQAFGADYLERLGVAVTYRLER
jgi:hypothetical protein